jgi:interferon-induced transmembrane protein
VSDTGSNDPYDPNRPPGSGDSTPPPPPPSQPGQPSQPQWGTNPPPAPGGGGEWPGGQQPGQPQYGQPQYGSPYGQPAGTPPPNYLVWAILSTVLCCLPLGIASIVFAAQVNGKYQAGDLAGAQEASRKAKQFAIWGAVAGIVVAVLYLLVIVALSAGSD